MTTIHLIGIGTVPAKPAGDLIPGDKIVFNYGYTYTVLAATVITVGGTIKIEAVDDRTGNPFTFKKRATTLMGVAR